MSQVNTFKVFQFPTTKYNRYKLYNILIYGIILFAIIFDFNLVRSLSVLEHPNENSSPGVFNAEDLPHLTDPEIQRELSQSFLQCSTKCSTLPDCLGVTIYKLNPPVSDENMSSDNSMNNFICKTSLADELSIEENSALPKLGTVFYKIMFRDKLPKFHRRKFTVPHSRSLDGESEKLIFTSSEAKRRKRDLSSGLPNEVQSATVSPQIKLNDGNEENLIPAEPLSGQQGIDVASPGNISETNPTTVTVKPSVLLQPEKEDDSIFHEQNVTPSKTISSVTLQPEINHVDIDTLFENETTTAKSISEPTPDTTHPENNAASNSTEKITTANETAENGKNVPTPTPENKTVIVNNSSIQETAKKEDENKVVVILPSPGENFSEDISPSDNTKTESSTEGTVVIFAPADHVFLSNNSNVVVSDTIPDSSENINPTQFNLSNNNSEATSVTESNSILLGPGDDNNIFNDVDDTVTPSATEKSPAVNISNFNTTENIFDESNSNSDPAKSVTENSTVIFLTEKDNVFTDPKSGSDSVTESSAVIFSTENDIFADNNSPSETTKSATENSAVIFSTENDIFADNNSPSETTKSATENSAVIFSTENDLFTDGNLISTTTESVTEKNSVIFPGEENVFEGVSLSSVPVENVTENNAIIFAGTDNIFDENSSSPVTVDSVTENNSISTDGDLSDDDNSSLETTESTTASSNGVVLDSTDTNNIFNDDNSSAVTTDSVTESNRINFSTEKDSIFDEDTSSPSSAGSVTASNEILLGPTENIFAGFNSTTSEMANPSEIITSTSTEKFLPPYASSDENISPGIIPDVNQWGNDTQKIIEDLKSLPENYSPILTVAANNSQLVPSAASKINSGIQPTSIPSVTNIQNKNIKKVIKEKGVGNKDKSKKVSVNSTKSKGQSNKNPSILHINFSTNIKIKKRGNETSITKIDKPSNVTVTYKKKIVKEKIPGPSSTVKPVKLSTNTYTPAEMNIDESSAGVTTSSDLGCSFQDSERYIRNIKSSSFSMLGGEETMLTFVSGVQSHCVSTLTRNGKQGIRSIESVLTGFPLALEVEAAGFVNEHIYIVDASGQNVWDFELDNITNLYANVPMKIPPHESTKEKFMEICQIEPDVDIQIKAFLQIHDKSCILFDQSRTPITSKSANEDTRDLAEAIYFLLETEFINYVESIFAWLNERFISSVYVYGSNGELYKIYRNASTEFKWRKGKYELMEYSILPLQN